jgi:hypothetical protein
MRGYWMGTGILLPTYSNAQTIRNKINKPTRMANKYRPITKRTFFLFLRDFIIFVVFFFHCNTTDFHPLIRTDSRFIVTPPEVKLISLRSTKQESTKYLRLRFIFCTDPSLSLIFTISDFAVDNKYFLRSKVAKRSIFGYDLRYEKSKEKHQHQKITSS